MPLKDALVLIRRSPGKQNPLVEAAVGEEGGVMRPRDGGGGEDDGTSEGGKGAEQRGMGVVGTRVASFTVLP